MFDCPKCKAQTPRLIIYENPRYLGCPACGVPKTIQHNVNLGQTESYYTKKDGSRGRITVGKANEIRNRVLAEDKITVINRVTGKETSF